ncbi:MAG TPA: insulinase family protein, partial [Anaeromyxobacteraceae bacterium]
MRRRRTRTTSPLTRGPGRGRAAARVDPRFCEARRRVLPNGLRVLTVPAPGLHSAMIALYVR